MYVIVEGNIVYLLIKQNTLLHTAEVSPVYLSKDGEVVNDENVVITIELSKVIFTTKNVNLIKDTLTELKEDSFELSGEDQEFNNEILDKEYFDDISNDSDYYIPFH